jgi:hypothetical protein
MGNDWAVAFQGQKYSDSVRAAVERLRNITGFVTTLVVPGDPRASVFDRHSHVGRVLRVNRRLCELQGFAPLVPEQLVVLHDLNRWPFAHNAERGRFDQAGNTPEFLRSLGYDGADPVIRDLAAFHQKDLVAMRKDARVALLADMLTGLVEDPMMAICGLNIVPEIMPRALQLRLYRDTIDEVSGRILSDVAAALHLDRDPDAFRQGFIEAFDRLLNRFLEVNWESVAHSVDAFTQHLFGISNAMKEQFLRPVIFPINNELVCHSETIRDSFIDPLITSLGNGPATELLLDLDEPGFVEYVIVSNVLGEVDTSPLYPSLEFPRMSPQTRLVK